MGCDYFADADGKFVADLVEDGRVIGHIDRDDFDPNQPLYAEHDLGIDRGNVEVDVIQGSER